MLAAPRINSLRDSSGTRSGQPFLELLLLDWICVHCWEEDLLRHVWANKVLGYVFRVLWIETVNIDWHIEGLSSLMKMAALKCLLCDSFNELVLIVCHFTNNNKSHIFCPSNLSCPVTSIFLHLLRLPWVALFCGT